MRIVCVLVTYLFDVLSSIFLRLWKRRQLQKQSDLTFRRTNVLRRFCCFRRL